MRDIDKCKPAARNTILLFLAGIAWECVGIMLLFVAFSWLSTASRIDVYLCSCAGVLLALLRQHFGFLKIADRNLKRILQMNGKKCLFSFIPWRSYAIIAAMVTAGALLRHSVIPKKYLATLYMGIGLALVLSSVRYIRVFCRETMRQKAT